MPGKVMLCICNRQGGLILPQMRVETLIESQAKYEFSYCNVQYSHRVVNQCNLISSSNQGSLISKYYMLTVCAWKLVRMLLHDGHSVLTLIIVIEFNVYTNKNCYSVHTVLKLLLQRSAQNDSSSDNCVTIVFNHQ